MDVTVEASDTFFWVRKFLKAGSLPTEPWLVFCCPPYALYVDRQNDLLTMLDSLVSVAPDGSLFVVESDERFDPKQLPQSLQWETRKYSPALISVGRKT